MFNQKKRKMKKRNLFYALTAGIVLFGACNNNSNEFTPSDDNAAQQLVLQVASSGDGLQTRAGRPLYASDAAQDIDSIQIIVKSKPDNKIAYVDKITNWKGISKAYTENGHGLQYTLTLKGENKLKQGDYTVVAVGYSQATAYTFNPQFNTLAKESILAENISGKIDGDAEEVFAGEAALTVKENGAFEFTPNTTGVVVTLHRQVAGGFGYFHNIPASVDGVKAANLRLVTINKNTQVDFKDFNTSFTTTGNKVNYVINGNHPATANAKFSDNTKAHTLYTIDLTKWFTAGDEDGDGFLTSKDAWTMAEGVKTNVVKGSVFAGRFMIPFALQAGKNTMELQLLDAAGNILRTWGVKIKATDKVTGDESVSIFNVVRNHMYNLGVKTTHNPEGPNPETPDPDTNQPEDLSKNQDLILKVNDNWEMIHQMELD